MIKVLVADDELRIRDGIANYINKFLNDFTVVCECSDGDEAIEYLKRNSVDIIITDIRMRRINGLELARYAQRERPSASVIMLSGYQEFEYAKSAISYGVKAYLLKPTDFEELTNVLMDVKPKYESDTASSFDNVELQQYDGLIKQILEYIDKNYANDISLQDVSKHVYLNPIYCSRLFKQEVGMNFSDYLLEKRMKKAAQMLLEYNKIEIVSASCGYNNSGYFSRVFKEFYGCTPKEYRTKVK